MNQERRCGLKKNAKAVQLSGVVYVKDPRDIDQIIKLKAQLNPIKNDNAQKNKEIQRLRRRVSDLERQVKQSQKIQADHQYLLATAKRLKDAITKLKTARVDTINRIIKNIEKMQHSEYSYSIKRSLSTIIRNSTKEVE